jgi:hypothetical protein
MPVFDWTITLGNALTIITMLVGGWLGIVRMYYLFNNRISSFEATIKIHADALLIHTARMEKQDDLLLRLVGDVQRLIGHLEARISDGR